MRQIHGCKSFSVLLSVVLGGKLFGVLYSGTFFHYGAGVSLGDMYMCVRSTSSQSQILSNSFKSYGLFSCKTLIIQWCCCWTAAICICLWQHWIFTVHVDWLKLCSFFKSFMIQFSVRLLKLAPCLCRDLKESQDRQDSRATQVHRLVTHRLSDMWSVCHPIHKMN